MNSKLAVTALAFAATLAVAANVDARPFKVTPDAHSETMATFSSKASIVRLSGRTTKVDGDSEINVDNPSLSPKGTVTVDVSSFDTGIALRNEHMRGIIEAEKYPTATFKMKSLKAPKLVAEKPVDGTVTGEMTFHGVTRTVTAPVTLVYLPEQDKNYRPGDWVSVTTGFKLKLSDYGIKLPAPMLGVKVADELSIEVEGMAKGL
ncbi:YceI family protein [bacterium]|nr:YceI family protein [bacterium]